MEKFYFKTEDVGTYTEWAIYEVEAETLEEAKKLIENGEAEIVNSGSDVDIDEYGNPELLSNELISEYASI